ncbi:MAG: hypothetical protein WCK41_12565, partial [Actinomycetes bacterium]
SSVEVTGAPDVDVDVDVDELTEELPEHAPSAKTSVAIITFKPTHVLNVAKLLVTRPRTLRPKLTVLHSRRR